MTIEQKSNKTEAEVSHQRQFVWQILIPVVAAVVMILVILFFSVSISGRTPELNEKWAHISTIFLLLPTFLFGLITLVLIIVLFWLLRKLTRRIPTYTGYIYYLSRQTTRITDSVTTHSAEPFIRVRSILAGMVQLITLIFHSKTNPKE